MKKYKIEITETFKEDMAEILKYIKNDLENEMAANRLLVNIEKAITERAENPLAYEKYYSKLNIKYDFYKIYVDNYIIFYIVYDDIMEVRRILNKKRNLRYFVREKSVRYIVKQGN